MKCFKKSVLCVLLMTMIIGITACGNSDMSKQTLEEGLYPMYEKGSVEDKWGYIDETGEYVIEPQFKYAGYFSEGLAAVQNKTTRLWGYIDSSGEYVIEPQFFVANSFVNGYARIEEKCHINGHSDYMTGYLASNGGMAISPQYGTAYDFDSNGFAIVQKGSYFEPQGYVVINKNGNEISAVSESDVAFESWDFSQGPLLYFDENSGMYGYINEEKEFVIEPNEKYNELGYFWGGRAPVCEEYDDGEYSGYIYGYMDDKGEMCTDLKFFSYGGAPVFVNNVCLVRTLPNEDGIVNYGYIDKEGKWIIKKEYDSSLDGEY